ncbi:MAG: hypothetical protein U0R80_13280 [Nocardioidaceae bacterium]
MSTASSRRAVLLGSGLAGAGLLAARPASAGGSTVDLWGEIAALRLTATSVPHATEGEARSLDLSGALLVAPYGALNWYFANLALAWSVPSLPLAQVRTVVLPHLEAYLRNLEPDLTIKDVAFPTYEGGVAPTSWERPARDRDSDDSYAATLLTPATRALLRLHASSRHRELARDWWSTHRATLTSIARTGLVEQIKADDLTATFRTDLPVPSFVPDRDTASVGYLMDGCEVQRGLRDLAAFVRVMGSGGGGFADAADRVARGVHRLWDRHPGAYRPSDADLGFHDTPAAQRSAFYPWVTAQVFPTLVDLPRERVRGAAAWAFVARHGSDWSTWPNHARPGLPDPYPWALVALAAARRARTVRPHRPAEARDLARQAARLASSVADHLRGRRAAVTVNELGAALATRALLVSQRA